MFDNLQKKVSHFYGLCQLVRKFVEIRDLELIIKNKSEMKKRYFSKFRVFIIFFSSRDRIGKIK